MQGHLSGLKNRYPLHIQIAALFTLLIVSIGSAIIIFNHSQLTKLAEISINRQYQKTGEATASELNAVTRSMAMSVNILADTQITEASTLEERMASIGKFIEILKQNNYASSVYTAYPNGDFFMLRRITAANRDFFKVPENANWLVQSNRFLDTHPEKRFIYLNDQLQVVAERIVDNDQYDPRTRSWFIQASKNPGLATSPNYIFKVTGETGFTYSRQAENKHAVTGLDVSLASLSQFLKQQSLPQGSQAAIINFANETIASQPEFKNQGVQGSDNFNSISRIPVLKTLLDSHQNNAQENAGGSIIFNAQDQGWYGSVVNIDNNGNKYQLVIATPSAYLTLGANSIRNRSTLVAFILLVFSLPIVWYFSRRISKPLIRLRKDAEAISNLIFDEGNEEHSAIEEVDDLHKAMSKMKQTLKQFISMGSILSAKDNFPQQMQGLLNEMAEIAAMNGGVIFLSDKHQDTFTPIAFRWNEQDIPVSEIASLRFDNNNPATFWQILENKTVSGVFDHQQIPDSLRTFFQPHFPLRYVAVPMQTHDEQLLGFLLLFIPNELSAKRENAKIQLVNALVGSLSVAIETQYLLLEQKNLLNAFIELIAGAIDAKSAYTGGHCQRVPEITKMLAKAAVDSKEGPFTDFTLSENEWEELHTACWLHDCGKITTPEFVVDKATKLELIYDRIHEIRMRFEVLKREKEILYLRNQLPAQERSEQEQQLAEELRQLDEDFYFIAQCNIGGEFLSDDALARVKQIADYQWTRTLDDTAGVSQAEGVRKTRQPVRDLPVQEAMLADKEEHIIYRDSKNHLPENYLFKLKEPKYLYNYGEIYNLSIRRGTLNDEERYKINEHIMQTIIMLNRLPFPRTMAQVPVIAGGHHERMDGKGYPYQLNYTQMSIPVRMMAIADVFEALTAADRPYKPGKSLSEALKIMTAMVNENHLDRELFILFLQSGVWRDYAMAYLQVGKVDEVDISALLQKLGPQNITL
ncbi:metal-dependent phosphohydrolase [Chania multitudinisentens RB-25]|uniref:Metal-dependent phosphohydrolase n=1 Tax=Chania multitudinisentens RB-25 TaxID=1441930 RepID=A0A0D4ZYF9_9GAMM|nr:HD domain-containing phosphohydrolase [Chania multitudinisentens]AJW28933.1 metal-dependent phosphohydrolase [Chania multitudinisentens RB-25]